VVGADAHARQAAGAADGGLSEHSGSGTRAAQLCLTHTHIYIFSACSDTNLRPATARARALRVVHEQRGAGGPRLRAGARSHAPVLLRAGCIATAHRSRSRTGAHAQHLPRRPSTARAAKCRRLAAMLECTRRRHAPTKGRSSLASALCRCRSWLSARWGSVSRSRFACVGAFGGPVRAVTARHTPGFPPRGRALPVATVRRRLGAGELGNLQGVCARPCASCTAQICGRQQARSVSLARTLLGPACVHAGVPTPHGEGRAQGQSVCTRTRLTAPQAARARPFPSLRRLAADGDCGAGAQP
jgi:hypothetical protein